MWIKSPTTRLSCDALSYEFHIGPLFSETTSVPNLIRISCLVTRQNDNTSTGVVTVENQLSPYVSREKRTLTHNYPTLQQVIPATICQNRRPHRTQCRAQPSPFPQYNGKYIVCTFNQEKLIFFFVISNLVLSSERTTSRNHCVV